MASKRSKGVKMQLRAIINKFPVGELERFVLPTFPELTWAEVRQELYIANEPLTAANIFTLIEALITKHKIRSTDIINRILALQAIEVIRHSDKRIWYGHRLVNIRKKVCDLRRKAMQERIERKILRRNNNIVAKVFRHDGIFYICIRDKINVRQMLNTNPLYFALFLEQSCFFCTRKVVPKRHLSVLVDSLGYESSSPIDIMGKNLKSLVRLLWNESNCTHQSEPKGEVYYAEDPELNDNVGTDFTESLCRRNYAKSCIGPETVDQQSLIIDVPKQQWKHEDILAKLSDTMTLQCEIRSPNVPDFLVKLVEQKALPTPLPLYIRKVLLIPKRAVLAELSTPVDDDDDDDDDDKDDDDDDEEEL